MDHEREELPVPHGRMTPEEKGELLLRYVASNTPVGKLVFLENDGVKEWHPEGLDFSGANLEGFDLQGAQLEGVRLEHAWLLGANLAGACLRGAVLTKAQLGSADLAGANLERAWLRGAELWKASLIGANLTWAYCSGTVFTAADLHLAVIINATLAGCDLSGANLQGVELDDVRWKGSKHGPVSNDLWVIGHRQLTTFNWATVQRSGWTEELLRQAIDLGLHPVDFEAFPESYRLVVQTNKLGLMLYFDSRLTRLDRFLVDGVVVGVLGRDTPVEVVEVSQIGNGTMVRLNGGTREDLEAVAEALWSRVWEAFQRYQLIDNKGLVGNQINVAGNATIAVTADVQVVLDRLDKLQSFGGSLSELHRHLARIELMLAKVGGESELVRRWGQEDRR